MNRPLRIILVALAFPALLLSCKAKEEEPQRLQPPKAAAPAEAAKPAQPLEMTARVEPTAPAVQRNPFMSYIILMKGREEAKKIKGPLECCELNLFRLLAVVESKDSAFALVQTPDNKRYVVRVGDMMGAREGKIVKISARSVTVRELTRDEEGKVVSTMDIDIVIPEKEAGAGAPR